MVDPKLFEVMKSERVVRAAVALVMWHALVKRPDIGPTPVAIECAFQQADRFLERALQP